MVATSDGPPRNVRWEIARLKQIKPICSESIDYCVDSDGQALISFDIETDILLDPSDREILDVEPIVFRYPTPASIGSRAPRVLSGRSDFPRDLPHVFPSTANEPVSMCLARSGLQAIYDSSGVSGVVSRLLGWLCDAKTGTLYQNGWEPVPHQIGQLQVFGNIDAKALQSLADENPEGGFRFICAGIRHLHAPENGVFVHAASPILDTGDVDQLNSAKEQMQQLNEAGLPFHTAIPAIFLWPPRNQIEDRPQFSTWRDIGSLQEGLREVGLYDVLDSAFDFVNGYFDMHTEEGELPESDKRGNRSLMVIVGLWRPVPLDPTIVGLATEDGPRCLELRGFYLQRPVRENDQWSTRTSLFDFFGLVPNDSATLKAVSGVSAFRTTAFLGAGALGSAFADYALRGGADRLTVVDKDCLLTHNIARHRGDSNHVAMRKTDVVQYMADTRVQNARIKKHNEDIVALDDESLAKKFCDVEQIIDATADPLVRRRLSNFKGIELPVMRSEIFHRGQLGVSLLTKLGSAQNLNCLFHQLMAMAMYKESVREWLAYENSRTYKDEELLLGFGCHTMTTKLPAYMVDAHASSAFALANARLRSSDQPLIALHQVDAEGVSLGTELIPAEPVSAFDDPRTNGWRAIVAVSVLEALHQMRRKATPDETGGYLFGAIDESASEIYVLAASPEPPGTSGSPTALQLGRWGLTGFEKTFLRRTCRRLPPIGTWHSHPTGDAEASTRDWATIKEFKAEDARRGLPTLMAITSPAGDAFYVEG